MTHIGTVYEKLPIGPIDDKTRLECLMHVSTSQRQISLENKKAGWQVFLMTLTFFVLSTAAMLEKQIMVFQDLWSNVLTLWGLFLFIAFTISSWLRRLGIDHRFSTTLMHNVDTIIISTTMTTKEIVHLNSQLSEVIENRKWFDEIFDSYPIQNVLVYAFALIASVILTFGVFIK